MTTSFKRGARVLYRRSILCGREPEFGIVVKRETINSQSWFVVRDEDRPESRGMCEHETMLTAADGWRDVEIIRLRADADTAARRENESLSYRYQAEALRACADRLAA